MSTIRRWLEVSMPADSLDYALWDSLGLRNEYVIITSVPSLNEIAENQDRWEGCDVTWTMTARTLKKALKKLITIKSPGAQRWAIILLEEKQSCTTYEAFHSYSEWITVDGCTYRWEPSPYTRRKKRNSGI